MTAALPTRSRLDEVLEPERFLWATGIEDTFITDPWPATGRTLDEYELTEHYQRWPQDVDLVASLGVSAVRWGVPWHRVNPAPDRWDWSFVDPVVDRFLERGIEPIVDLVHYGTPKWLEHGFLSADYSARVAEYAAAVADRYRGRLRWYTPFNEPRIAAWYCGRIGWWPPYRRSWRGFVQVLVAIARGIVATDEALRATDRDLVLVHVDATDVYASDDPTLASETERRQQIVFLALDLVAGRVDGAHPLVDWIELHGIDDATLDWFTAHRVELDVVGINLYPMFTSKRLLRTGRGMRVKMVYAGGDLVERLGEAYGSRYRRPLMITETASLGGVRRRLAWLETSTAAVARLRAQGVPVVGYTWWPLFSLVAWAYRQSGRRAVADYLLRMGLVDLEPTGQGLARRPTAVYDAYRALCARGAAPVGALAAPPAAESGS